MYNLNFELCVNDVLEKINLVFCFVLEKIIRGVWGSIRSGWSHKLPTPRAGAKNNVRGELDKGIAFEDMKEEKFPRNGWMGIFEVWHGRVSSRGVLETGRGLWKTEKESESDGRTGIKGVYSWIRDKQL